MSYNSNTKTITDTGADDGVSFHDIQQPFDTKENRLGGLCKNESINVWAKYKPVVYLDDNNKPELNTVDQWDFNSNTWKASGVTRPWWQGYPRNLSNYIYNCGMLVYQYPNVEDLLADYRGNKEHYGWSYVSPGDGEGYRTLDFTGYRHNATPLFRYFITSKDIYSSGSGTNDPVILSMDSTVSNTQGFLSWADFPELGSYYWGVVVWPVNSVSNDDYAVVTMSTAIGSLTENDACEVKFTPFHNGKYYAIPFLSPDSKTSFGKQNIPSVFCIGSFEKVMFEVASDSRKWIAIESFSWSDSPNHDAVYIDVKYKTYRIQGEGNYDNNNKVAVYSTTVSLINKDGRVIPPATRANTFSKTFIESTARITIDCAASGSAVSTNSTRFEISKNDWPEEFTEYNYIRVATRVYKGIWNDTTLEWEDATLGCDAGESGDVENPKESIEPHDIIIDSDSQSSGSIDIKPGGFPTGQYDNP